MRKLDLTGDRPLTSRDARALHQWWHGFNGWHAELINVGKFYRVIITKTQSSDAELLV